ncbi:hypothetical protein [uncultured Aquimarina sp.]|uniref:hypothetical protein n=1 Tax=uncultured Aquimarina sp. TaxID=575652 RepID=UPI0026077322|nr:hypothetical protein [uncultured Aquimarina sp.]
MSKLTEYVEKLKKTEELLETKKMTPQRLMTFKGFEDYELEQAERELADMKELARAIYRQVKLNHLL